MNFTSDDILGIAHALSSGDDTFSPNNLVSFGKTVIVKPGATTRKGRPVTGPEVAAKIGAMYGVFPMAVEYDVARGTTMDSDAQAIGALERELNAVTEDEVGAMDADLFGQEGAPVVMSRRASRLRRRYIRVLARWRKNATMALISGKKHRKRRSERQFKRIEKIWSKMEAKGVPTQGLIPPKRALRQVLFSSSSAGQSQRMPPASAQKAVYAPPQQEYQRPPGGADHPLYHEDQRRENLRHQALSDSLMADYMGADPHEYQEAQDDLSADIRAETVGFLFGLIEHDYWGDVSEEIQVLSSDPEDEEVLDSDLAEEEADAAEDEESLDEPGQGQLAPDAAPAPPTASQSDAEVDALLSETDSLLEEEGEGEDLDTEDDEDALEAESAEAPSGPSDSDIEQIVEVAEQIVAVPLTIAQQGAAARKRARMNKLLAQLKAVQAKNAAAIQSGKVSKAGRTAKKQARLNRRILALEKSLRESDSAVTHASESGSVNYRRLKPLRPGAAKLARRKGRPAPPVVVAIKKRKHRGHHRQKAVMRHARMGGIQSNGSLLDVFATEMAVYESSPQHYVVPEGYSALEAAYMLDQATEPQDYLGDADGPDYDDEWGIGRGRSRRTARRAGRKVRRSGRREARRPGEPHTGGGHPRSGERMPEGSGGRKRSKNQKAYRVARKAYREAFKSGRIAELPALAAAMQSAWAGIKNPQRRAEMKNPAALLAKFPITGRAGGSSNALSVFGARMRRHGPHHMGAGHQFPFGAGAPFPPPRTEGEEVYG